MTSLSPPRPGTTAEDAQRFRDIHDRVLTEVERSVRGKSTAIRLALACLFSGGHLLIEDIPGTGKTSLAKALASSVAGRWSRVQFTPDLLPTDITGVSVWDEHTRAFTFRPGPVFANVVLADEINRASPKTQSALLEVMEEGQVTVDGASHSVPQPFLVVATQNPVDTEGTYRLPEAQLDRFVMRIALGPPDVDVETEILSGRATGAPTAPRIVAPVEYVQHMRQVAGAVHVTPEISRYIALLAQASRKHPTFRLAISTRGSLALLKAAQAYAIGHGRTYVVPDDVRTLAHPVLAHRLILTAEAEIQGISVTEVLDEVLASVPVPGIGDAR